MQAARFSLSVISVFIYTGLIAQPFDTSQYHIQVELHNELNTFFTKDLFWLGADGASSVDLENGNLLWLFSDSFICTDSSGLRENAKIIRNSIAIQTGYDPAHAEIKYYWNNSEKNPQAFFQKPGEFWYWTGDGMMIKDKLLIFLIKEKKVETDPGFEAAGWDAALISNPHDVPTDWVIQYIDGAETFGTIAGSAALIKDENYIYAYGAVEPSTHEVYLLRWEIDSAYSGHLSNPEWWEDGAWRLRTNNNANPQVLFVGATEYSVHFDAILKKYIQIQSYGFGKGQLGMRMSDRPEGPWTDPLLFYTPEYPGVKQPFMYAAKAHPEIPGNKIFITYNVNSFDLTELLENKTIYFPKFISIQLTQDTNH